MMATVCHLDCLLVFFSSFFPIPQRRFFYLNSIETRPQVTLLLENDVGAGNSLGLSFEQLAAMLVQLPQYQDRLGICIDTAHLWGAGYDISSADSTLQVLQNCEDTLGLARLKVIHLNDTAMALGSHRDVHKRLGEGIIGNEG